MPINVTHFVGRPAFDWEQIVYEATLNGTFTLNSASEVTLSTGVYTLTFIGTGFALDGTLSAFTSGIITGINISQNSTTVVAITGLSAGFAEINTGLEEIVAIPVPELTPPYYTQAFKDAFTALYDDGVTATGSADGDAVLGGLGDDNLSGGDGDDYIDASAGNNFVNGGGGNDYVQGTTNFDDRMWDELNGGQNADPETQGRDFDFLSYENFGNKYLQGVNIDVQLGQTTASFDETNFIIDYFYNFEHYLGTEFADNFYGSVFDDEFTGRAGNDTFIGYGGRDTVNYGAGNIFDATSTGVIVDLTGEAGFATDSSGDQDSLFGIESIIGSHLNDIITGSSDHNFIDGNAGSDEINGGDGNDSLIGGDGGDTINGGEGDDYINGGEGDDVINAGNGRYDFIEGSIGADTINGDAGYDDLSYTGELANTYEGTDAMEFALFGGGLGRGSATGTFGNTMLGVTMFENIEQIEGSKGNDTFTATDVDFTNTAEADYTFNGARGAAGVITIIGGLGNDTYYISTDTVKVDYGIERWLHQGFNDNDGRQWGDFEGEFGVVLNMSITERDAGSYMGHTYGALLGGKGLDTFGTIDTFSLGVSNLVSVGLTDTHDLVWTNDNSTYIDARMGNDEVNGGAGDDEFNGGEGDDTLNGGAGQDRLNGQSGNDNINGEDGHDNINGDDGDDIITGGAGLDNLNGGNGMDSISGGAGRDNINGENDDDILSGNEDNDDVDGGDGADQIFGGTGNDNVRGGSGADLVRGDGGDDRAEGGDGEDIVVGGDGNDQVDGGNEIDWVTGNLGDDRVQGGSGNDKLLGDDEIENTLFTDTQLINRHADGIILLGGNDRMWGDSGNDLMFGGFGHDEMSGGDNDDQLYGGFGNDRLWGDSGIDILDGGEGDDVVEGGAGNDVLRGGEGSDLLMGGSENDTLSGGEGADSLEGGFGNDTYILNLNDNALDFIWDEGGVDIIQSTHNVDMLRFNTVENLTLTGSIAAIANGNNLANVITGNGSVNVLEGRGGHDMIFGGGGNDTLRGEIGNDTLYGGAGRDSLYGGTGALELDVFRYTAITESGTTSTTRDIIYDFTDGKDKINLSAIDANTSVAGNGTFGVLAIGTATSAVAAGKIGWYQFNSTNNALDRTFLRINSDADATIEMTIEIVGLKTITTADFVL